MYNSAHSMQNNTLPEPKKRGRRPLSDEERARRQKAPKKKEHDTMHISFVCDDEQSTSGAPRTLAASEVIQLLNSGNNDAGSIPARSKPKAVERPSSPKQKQSLLLEESDSDDDRTAKIRSQLHLAHTTAEQIVTVLGSFTDVKSWPASTDKWCHNCAHPFDGVPVLLPGQTDKYSGSFIKCSGNFCSFNCAKRAALDTNTFRSFEQSSLLTALHRRVVGHFSRIQPAPPKIALKVFGGYMEIEEYRRGFLQLPPTPEMYTDAPDRGRCVQLLQDNCWPSFAKLHVTNTDAVMSTSMTDQSARKQRYERTKPVKQTGVEKALNMSYVVHHTKEASTSADAD